MYIRLEATELPPLVRLGFEYSRGDVFEAYSHLEHPDAHIVINRTAPLRRREQAAQQQAVMAERAAQNTAQQE